VETSLDKFNKNGMKALVLDLRNNPGGLLTSAVEVSEKFLDDGKLVVYTEGRVRNQNMRFSAHAKKPLSAVPMVVLVNQGSASASEIVAGALQDYNRAVLVGTQTFGKGSVQTIIPLSDGSGLRLTTAKYFTPKGRSIHGKGITPDVVVELPKETPGAAPKPPSLDPMEDLKKDVQLQKALEVLKTMRVERPRPGGPQASAR
jgi:carboxyl-terminal processing protease